MQRDNSKVNGYKQISVSPTSLFLSQHLDQDNRCPSAILSKNQVFPDVLLQLLMTPLNPKPALIHCASGMRAGAMAFMNLATRQGLTPEQIFSKAEEAGFDCNANPQLKQFLEHYISVHSTEQVE